MSSKEYIIVSRKPFRKRFICNVVDRFTITCIGGEKMSKQEPQMVFVEPDTVPTRNKRKPKDYSKLFQKIPLNKVWKIKDGDKNFKISTIQEAAKKYENITATQRTVEGTRYLFVTRTGDV